MTAFNTPIANGDIIAPVQLTASTDLWKQALWNFGIDTLPEWTEESLTDEQMMQLIRRADPSAFKDKLIQIQHERNIDCNGVQDGATCTLTGGDFHGGRHWQR